MAFQASISESECQQLIGLLDLAVKAGGLQAAKAAVAIANNLEVQARNYNQSLIEKTEEHSKPELFKEV